MTRIAYLGNFQHPWCTEVHLARELEGLGHAVHRIQEPPGGAEATFLPVIETQAGEFGADVLFFQRTWGLPAEATALWRRLEASGCLTASYHLDLYRGLAREERLHRDPFWTTGYVFTPDGNPESQEWFEAQGINHHYMPPGVVSDECYRGTFRPELAHDVVFVGSLGYHPEYPWRGEMIGRLESAYGDRFVRYGGDTGYTVGGKRHAGPIRGAHLNDLYASAKVIVGDSCFAHRGQRYTSDRPWETTGRGGFIVNPRIDMLRHLLPIPAIDYFEPADFGSLRAVIDHWLVTFDRDPALRTELTGTSLEWVREHGSYRNRLAGALEVIGL